MLDFYHWSGAERAIHFSGAPSLINWNMGMFILELWQFKLDHKLSVLRTPYELFSLIFSKYFFTNMDIEQNFEMHRRAPSNTARFLIFVLLFIFPQGFSHLLIYHRICLFWLLHLLPLEYKFPGGRDCSPTSVLYPGTRAFNKIKWKKWIYFRL